jgi:hypothetical protein
LSRYKFNDVEYVSPSEVLGLLGKGDALLFWASKLALQHGKVDAFKTVRENTADIGSELHNTIETYINIKLKQHTPDFSVLLKDKSDIHNQMFNQFLVWEKNTVKTWLESENQVVHQELCYAGTLDMIFVDKDDNIVLCDLKTKNELYNDERFQIAAYKYARESMFGKYKIHCQANGQDWIKEKNYGAIKIDKICILKIARDFFDLEYKDFTKGCERAFKSFCSLLDFYYLSADRRLKNNKRALELKEGK